MAKKPTQLPVAFTRVDKALAESIPLVMALVASGGSDFLSLRVLYRGQHDYIAIAKGWDEDGEPRVCFGSGTDFIGCLLGLESAIDADKWRPDKWADK